MHGPTCIFWANLTTFSLQDELVERVAGAAHAPVTLVVMSGSAVDVSAAEANPNVGAIIWVGYPGQAGGT